MFNTVPTIPVTAIAPLLGNQNPLPPDSVGNPSMQPTELNILPVSFGVANEKLLEEQIMYQQMLNDILYTSNMYSGWDNIPMFNIQPMNFNLSQRNNFQTNPFNLNSNLLDYNKSNQDNQKTTDFDSSRQKINMSLIGAGYDLIKGQKLANIAKKNATGFKGYCAKASKSDIQKAGLGKYEYGHAKDCDRILDRNPNFKRVDISLSDLKKTPGIVLVYKAGVSGYNKKYGHIEITGGDGCAYSDGKTRNIRPGYIAYAPVSKSSKSYTA